MVQVLFLIQTHLHEKLPLAKPLAISKMAGCSKKQKRAVILRRKRLLQRCFFHFEKSSFLVKTVLLKKIQKLDVAYEDDTTEIRDESEESDRLIDCKAILLAW